MEQQRRERAGKGWGGMEGRESARVHSAECERGREECSPGQLAACRYESAERSGSSSRVGRQGHNLPISECQFCRGRLGGGLGEIGNRYCMHCHMFSSVHDPQVGVLTQRTGQDRRIRVGCTRFGVGLT